MRPNLFGRMLSRLTLSRTDEQCLYFSDTGDDVLQLPKIGVSQISKKTRRVGLESLFVGLCLLFAIPAYAVESIRSFHADITVSADGSIEVVETIRVRAEGKRIRRGIYRDFTTDHIDPDGTKVHFDFQFIRVLRDGEADEYHQEPRRNGVRLYVGKADYFLPVGEYTYTIHYRAGHHFVFFDNHDVLYWNVAGSWPFAVEDASATVKLPDGIPQGSVTLDGYIGSFGSQEQAFESEMRSDGTAHFRATRVLQSEEFLILVIVLPKGFLVDPTLSDDDGELN